MHGKSVHVYICTIVDLDFHAVHVMSLGGCCSSRIGLRRLFLKRRAMWVLLVTSGGLVLRWVAAPTGSEQKTPVSETTVACELVREVWHVMLCVSRHTGQRDACF